MVDLRVSKQSRGLLREDKCAFHPWAKPRQQIDDNDTRNINHWKRFLREILTKTNIPVGIWIFHRLRECEVDTQCIFSHGSTKSALLEKRLHQKDIILNLFEKREKAIFYLVITRFTCDMIVISIYKHVGTIKTTKYFSVPHK